MGNIEAMLKQAEVEEQEEEKEQKKKKKKPKAPCQRGSLIIIFTIFVGIQNQLGWFPFNLPLGRDFGKPMRSELEGVICFDSCKIPLDFCCT